MSDLKAILGQSQPTLSRHLRILCEGGVLERSREGPFAYFRVGRDGYGARLAVFLAQSDADNRSFPRDRGKLDDIIAKRQEAARAFFDRNAGQWDRMRGLYIDEKRVEARLIEIIGQWRQPDSQTVLLDLGTGTGRMLEVLAPHFAEAVGVDLSHRMLALARAALEKAMLRNCRLQQADIGDLPWDEPIFDLAVMHQVLHYAEDPAHVIGEAARVIKGEGGLIVVDFATHDLDDLARQQAHRRFGFADADIEDWFHRAGLTPGQTETLPGESLTVKIWAAKRYSPVSLSKKTGKPRRETTTA